MSSSSKREKFVNSVRVARITYLAKQGLSDVQIMEAYNEARNANFVKMIADRARREMEELNHHSDCHHHFGSQY